MKNFLASKFWDGSKNNLIAVAHRGGDAAGIEKENSLVAFKAAYKLGYRWFETDVVPTKDGKLLAIHGRGYQRHPNKDLPPRVLLQRLTYAQVKNQIKIGGEPPVLLQELLDAFPDAKFFLDPKTYKAAPVLSQLLSRRVEDLNRIWVGSFLPFNTSRVKKSVKKTTNQKLGVAILGPLRGLLIKLASRAPWLSFLARAHIQWTGAGSIHIPYKWVTKKSGRKFINTAHSLGLRVGVYTPNDKANLELCRDKEVDIIMTDRISLLKEVILDKNPHNLSIK